MGVYQDLVDYLKKSGSTKIPEYNPENQPLSYWGKTSTSTLPRQ